MTACLLRSISTRVNRRWIIVALAVIAAAACALSVQGQQWWTLARETSVIEIGPAGAQKCFAGDCEPLGLGWIGAGERWMRLGIATWAGGMIAMLALLALAATVAAKRRPVLLAKVALVALATVTLAGTLFVGLFPGLP